MTHTKWIALTLFALLTMASSTVGFAGVSPEEAEQLKTTLTPFGAERAGNADGTIPAWEGGITAPPPGLGYKGDGTLHPDPFAADKVLFSINAQNMEQYAEKLTPGMKALLQKHPDTFRLDVYPTRRSHAAPQWVYDNTFRNATRASVSEDGLSVLDAYGGIAFPIPKTGEEVIYNHITRYVGTHSLYTPTVVTVSQTGRITITQSSDIHYSYPYYVKDGSYETWNGYLYKLIGTVKEPARRKGETALSLESLNQMEIPRKSWIYLPGQRRVRRAPDFSHDTPKAGSNGLQTYDDKDMFNGSLERFDWKLLGKKEMYIPYNCYKADAKVPYEELLHKGHYNPDYIRWELHRVWVVEATLKKGKRHIYGKRIFYLDEDSWIIALRDAYDNRDVLWRTAYGMLKNEYQLPSTILRANTYLDLLKDQYTVIVLLNDQKDIRYHVTIDDSIYTPENVRRISKR